MGFIKISTSDGVEEEISYVISPTSYVANLDRAASGPLVSTLGVMAV
jgi:hypothetical protein